MKEKLQNRILELENLLRQQLANYNAVEGAKQECQRLLDDLKKKEEEEEEKLLSS